MAADAPVPRTKCVEGYLFVRTPPRLLLLRRPPGRGSVWVPVSGRVEPWDADLVATVRREVSEETGFTDPRSVFPLRWEVDFEGPDGGPWHLTAFGVELEVTRPPRLSDEHVEFEWVSFGEARRRLHFPDNRDAVARLERVAFPPSGETVDPLDARADSPEARAR